MPTPPEAMTGTLTAAATALVKREVEAGFGAVAVHRGQQDFAGAQGDDFAREGDRVDARRAAPAMGEDLPAGDGPGAVILASIATTMHWLPNFSAAGADEIAIIDRRGIDRDLVGAGEQQFADVLGCAHAAADRQRHETGLGRALHDIEQGRAIFVARGNVEKAEFVGAGRVIGDRALRRDRRRRADRRN